MKIIHIANFYGPKSGGIKTTLHNLGIEYQKMGHQFVYIVPGKKFGREEKEHGSCITMPSWPIPLSGGYRIIRSNRQLKILLSSMAPDKIEVSDRFTLSSIGSWAKDHNIPAVVFSHETLSGLMKNYFGYSFRRFTNWHNTRLASRFDHVITTTEYASTEFKAIKSTNLVQIPLGVDLDTFHPDNFDLELREKLIKGGEVLLIHCGRLSPEKKPERSIEALRILLDRGINARLVYVGHGPLYSKMYKSTRDIPVTFWGYVANRHLLAKMLASADISLAPGPLETFCLAALESLASGTPVVASSSSAVGEFLRVESGEAVGITAENNGVAFADAIEEMLATISSDQTLSTRCHQQALKFPWSTTAKKLNELKAA
jgi:alpha-1,6-mannosyltransferase